MQTKEEYNYHVILLIHREKKSFLIENRIALPLRRRNFDFSHVRLTHPRCRARRRHPTSTNTYLTLFVYFI